MYHKSSFINIGNYSCYTVLGALTLWGIVGGTWSWPLHSV